MGPRASALLASAVLLLLAVAVAAVSETKSYGVKSLSNTSCVFAQGIEGAEPYLLGNDRGPLVVGASGLYYVSDAETSNFDPSDITLRSTSIALVDGLFSDLGDGSFWTFATSATTGSTLIWTTSIPLRA